ncbi:MAG: hypothetical protein HOJ30_02920 [Halieaceae bacterium]|jgi:hypothetical protein|nr:hypothetical protein [Halieaceae bacterium]MDG1492514.1 hypothetical protein [Luminiphilus sp.]MBT6264379.1 hypothetical protein [Halieaceae bacterium]MBT6332698.1 hypothetical protein [Halieaceae bacterium]MBT7339598.1 hypothetical protein [Halieaceae bacterium]
MKFRSPLLLLLGIFITGVASADEVTTPVVSVVNVQTSDPGAYRAYLIENPEIFEALGAESGGTCTTVSGHRYPGQAFAFSFYNDAGSAFKAATRFANMPRSAELDAISSVVSAEFYAVIKPFTLPPGFERRYQIVVNDAAAYVAAATKLEQAMQANGHKVEVGIFQPLGNGHQKANVLDVRIFAVEPEVAGMMVNDFLQRKAWALEPYGEMLATIESLELDTFEDCKQVYSAN